MSDSQEVMEVEAIAIEVDALPIELYKALKVANAVSGGGEAKHAIGEGYVAVNGELELRKRRKLQQEDVIEFNGEFYVVIYAPKEAQTEHDMTLTDHGALQASNTGQVASPEKPVKGQSGKASKKAKGNPKKAPNKQKAAKSENKKPQRDANTGRKAISF